MHRRLGARRWWWLRGGEVVVCVNRGGCASVTQDKKGKGRLILEGVAVVLLVIRR